MVGSPATTALTNQTKAYQRLSRDLSMLPLEHPSGVDRHRFIDAAIVRHGRLPADLAGRVYDSCTTPVSPAPDDRVDDETSSYERYLPVAVPGVGLDGRGQGWVHPSQVITFGYPASGRGLGFRPAGRSTAWPAERKRRARRPARSSR